MKKLGEMTLEDQKLADKEVAFYQSFVSAWIENRMEKDKSLLNLSALAIGLIMTFCNDPETVSQFVLWFLSLSLFIFNIIIILRILKKNSDYVIEVIKNNNPTRKESLDNYLNRRDIVSSTLFILGIISVFVLAVMKSKFVIMFTMVKP